MTHSINLTHDGTLILRIPKGYKVDKVVVEEMGTDNRVEYVPDTNVGELVNKSGDLVKGLVNNEVPSVQPTHPTPSNTLGVLDCVDRQAAIDAMCWACGHDCDKSKFVYNAPQDEQVIMCPEHYALSTLPSAQPERKKGKWIRTRTMTHDGELYCDQCEQEHPEQKKIWNFCPNCGADMRGSEQV